MSEIEKTKEYFSWIGDLKKRYRSTQIKAAVSVNAALIEFYWSLGKDICERYPTSRLGNQFYKMLSADLKAHLPDARGLSPSSLKYCGYFYRLYAKLGTGQQVVDLSAETGRQVADSKNMPECAKHGTLRKAISTPSVVDLLVRVPWGHHMLITDKCGGDMVLNTPQENPAIGLLVCRGKNAPLAKYLLGKIDMPIGVSDYELLRKVPDGFKSQLPTIEEIEAELASMERDAK